MKSNKIVPLFLANKRWPLHTCAVPAPWAELLPGDSRPPYKKRLLTSLFWFCPMLAQWESTLQSFHQGSSLVGWCVTTEGQLTSKKATFIWYGFHRTWHRLACFMPDKPLRAGSGVRLRFRTDCISGLCSIESLQHGPNYHHLPCVYLQFIVYVCFILSATWPCKGFNFEGGVCVWRKSRLYLIPNDTNICIWHII